MLGLQIDCVTVDAIGLPRPRRSISQQWWGKCKCAFSE